MEYDIYSSQKRVWRGMKKEVNKTIQINTITREKWTSYFGTIYAHSSSNSTKKRMEKPVNMGHITHEPTGTIEQLNEDIHKLKNTKAPGEDNIPNELIKYGENILAIKMQKLFDKSLTKN